MALLTALRQLHGDYGSVNAGETFVVSEDLAEELEARGLVERYRMPAKALKPPANKMLKPSENK